MNEKNMDEMITPKRKIRMIVTDMDYTLLNKEKKISAVNRKAIKEAMEAGVHVVLATGRLFSSAVYYAKELEISTPIIASNGAIIAESDLSRIYYQKTLPLEAGREMLKLCRERGLFCHLYTKDAIYTEKIVNISERYLEWNDRLNEADRINIVLEPDLGTTLDREHRHVLKAVVVDKDERKIAGIREEILKTGVVEVSQSLPDNIEVMDKEVNKGRAVEFLAKMYDVHPDEIMAIGDNENDLPMIKFAGLGVAVGNAEQCLLDHADHVTARYDEDGVAQVIYKYVLV
mgnify:CR=1 FL=1